MVFSFKKMWWIAVLAIIATYCFVAAVTSFYNHDYNINTVADIMLSICFTGFIIIRVKEKNFAPPWSRWFKS